MDSKEPLSLRTPERYKSLLDTSGRSAHLLDNRGRQTYPWPVQGSPQSLSGRSIRSFSPDSRESGPPALQKGSRPAPHRYARLSQSSLSGNSYATPAPSTSSRSEVRSKKPQETLSSDAEAEDVPPSPGALARYLAASRASNKQTSAINNELYFADEPSSPMQSPEAEHRVNSQHHPRRGLESPGPLGLGPGAFGLAWYYAGRDGTSEDDMLSLASHDVQPTPHSPGPYAEPVVDTVGDTILMDGQQVPANVAVEPVSRAANAPRLDDGGRDLHIHVHITNPNADGQQPANGTATVRLNAGGGVEAQQPALCDTARVQEFRAIQPTVEPTSQDHGGIVAPVEPIAQICAQSGSPKQRFLEPGTPQSSSPKQAFLHPGTPQSGSSEQVFLKPMPPSPQQQQASPNASTENMDISRTSDRIADRRTPESSKAGRRNKIYNSQHEVSDTRAPASASNAGSSHGASPRVGERTDFSISTVQPSAREGNLYSYFQGSDASVGTSNSASAALPAEPVARSRRGVENNADCGAPDSPCYGKNRSTHESYHPASASNAHPREPIISPGCEPPSRVGECTRPSSQGSPETRVATSHGLEVVSSFPPHGRAAAMLRDTSELEAARALLDEHLARFAAAGPPLADATKDAEAACSLLSRASSPLRHRQASSDGNAAVAEKSLNYYMAAVASARPLIMRGTTEVEAARNLLDIEVQMGTNQDLAVPQHAGGVESARDLLEMSLVAHGRSQPPLVESMNRLHAAHDHLAQFASERLISPEIEDCHRLLQRSFMLMNAVMPVLSPGTSKVDAAKHLLELNLQASPHSPASPYYGDCTQRLPSSPPRPHMLPMQEIGELTFRPSTTPSALGGPWSSQQEPSAHNSLPTTPERAAARSQQRPPPLLEPTATPSRWDASEITMVGSEPFLDEDTGTPFSKVGTAASELRNGVPPQLNQLLNDMNRAAQKLRQENTELRSAYEQQLAATRRRGNSLVLPGSGSEALVEPVAADANVAGLARDLRKALRQSVEKRRQVEQRHKEAEEARSRRAQTSASGKVRSAAVNTPAVRALRLEVQTLKSELQACEAGASLEGDTEAQMSARSQRQMQHGISELEAALASDAQTLKMRSDKLSAEEVELEHLRTEASTAATAAAAEGLAAQARREEVLALQRRADDLHAEETMLRASVAPLHRELGSLQHRYEKLKQLLFTYGSTLMRPPWEPLPLQKGKDGKRQSASELDGMELLIRQLARRCGSPEVAFISLAPRGRINTPEELGARLILGAGIDFPAVTGLTARQIFANLDRRGVGVISAQDLAECCPWQWSAHGAPSAMPKEKLRCLPWEAIGGRRAVYDEAITSRRGSTTASKASASQQHGNFTWVPFREAVCSQMIGLEEDEALKLFIELTGSRQGTLSWDSWREATQDIPEVKDDS